MQNHLLLLEALSKIFPYMSPAIIIYACGIAVKANINYLPDLSTLIIIKITPHKDCAVLF